MERRLFNIGVQNAVLSFSLDSNLKLSSKTECVACTAQILYGLGVTKGCATICMT
jgi:hypothetical protein